MRNSLDDLAIIALSDSSERESARDMLFAGYERVIRQIISKHNLFLPSGDQEDLVQEGFLGLLDALSHFDVSRGDFSPFAWRVVERKLLDAVRAETRKKNAVLTDSVELDSEKLEDNLDPVQNYIVSESRIRIERTLKEMLSKKDYDIFLLYREKRSYKEISEELSLTEKAVDNALQRIKKRILKNPTIFSE